ncbi:MAG: imelysin family protein [Halobacteriovoraceae bacterium]|nr:imelysin family protein [Halobacteriovoraceae bacterium]
MYKLIISNVFLSFSLLIILSSDNQTILNAQEPYLQENASSFSIQKMLSQYAHKFFYPHYRDFAQYAQSLDSQIDKYCENLHDEKASIKNRKDARESFKKAMLKFHNILAFQIGPILQNSSQTASKIYTPLEEYDYCAIDNQVIKAELGEHHATKGMGVLEYLLFDEEFSSRCHITVDSLVNWQNKDLNTRKKDRCLYMRLITDDLLTLSSDLKDAWDPKKGNWGEYLITGTSPRNSLTQIFDSLYYLETGVKDGKLVFLREGNENREHQDSNLFPLALAANLEGFLRIFTGQGEEDRMGLADFVYAKGHGELAQKIIDTSEKLIKRLKQQTGNDHSTEEGSQSNEFYKEIYKEVRMLTDILKLELPIILNITPTVNARGDGDM